MSITEQFRGEVESYLADTGLDATTFGKRAMNDPRFVFDLRKGRSPSARTMDRVRAFMTEYVPSGPIRNEAFVAAVAGASTGEERLILAEAAKDTEIPEEDQLRANWYRLLARLLASAPDAPLVGQIAGLSGDAESEFGQSLTSLAAAARAGSPEMIRQEYFDLFIGVGQSELVPYASYYLTGFLHEKPLARLRDDLAELGIGRADGVSESEDHIAALCEMMAGMIMGRFGAPVGLQRQHEFFRDHIGCWAPRFFEDLEAAPTATFYMPVGTIGRLFLAVESQAFDMAA